MKARRHGKHGFSLAETLATLFILVLVLGSVGTFARLYSSQVMYTTKRDQALAGTQVAVLLMQREISEAINIITPPSGSISAYPTLSFQTLNPDVVQLPPTLPNPPAATWDPYAAAYLMTVTYSVSNNFLVRQVTPNGGAALSTRVASELAGFSCQFTGTKTLEFTLSFAEESHIRVVKMDVERRL
jgi:type II secretory pathway component PulJ